MIEISKVIKASDCIKGVTNKTPFAFAPLLSQRCEADVYLKKEIKIPVGVKDKEQFVLRGEGVTDVHGRGKGDMVVQVKIVYPQKLNDEQKELITKLGESFGYESNPLESKFDGVLDKVKGWFN